MMMGYLCFENWNWIDNICGQNQSEVNAFCLIQFFFNVLIIETNGINFTIYLISQQQSHLPNLSFSTIHQTQNIIFPTLIRQIMSRIQALFSQYVVHWTQSSNSDAFIFAGWTVFIFGIRVQIIIHRLKDSKAKNLCAPLAYKILLQPV